jgi:hypothetical protein
MAGPQIDRDKLRDAVLKLGDEYVFYMLDDAIQLLPEGKLLRGSHSAAGTLIVALRRRRIPRPPRYAKPLTSS